MRPLILTELAKVRITAERKARWQAGAKARNLTLSGFIEECVEKELSGLQQVHTAPFVIAQETPQPVPVEKSARETPVAAAPVQTLPEPLLPQPGKVVKNAGTVEADAWLDGFDEGVLESARAPIGFHNAPAEVAGEAPAIVWDVRKDPPKPLTPELLAIRRKAFAGG